jgi:hypothetical protein
MELAREAEFVPTPCPVPKSTLPFTVKEAPGDVVPMPTLPPEGLSDNGKELLDTLCACIHSS